MFHLRLGGCEGGKDSPRFNKECLDIDVNRDLTSKGSNWIHKSSSHIMFVCILQRLTLSVTA